MDNKTFDLLNEVNRSIIKFRGIYSAWAGANDISYNEMLVLYTLREHSYCTQRLICDSYKVSRQTINNVISRMRADGLLKIDHSIHIGHEKAFILTDKGLQYTEPLFASLETLEKKTVETFGKEKLEILSAMMLEYMQTLNDTLEEMV